MARKPWIPKTLRKFTGCYIGEPRVGILIETSNFDKHEKMVRKGYLQRVEAPPNRPKENHRIWYALTAKGKKTVAKRENYYAELI